MCSLPFEFAIELPIRLAIKPAAWDPALAARYIHRNPAIGLGNGWKVHVPPHDETVR